MQVFRDYRLIECETTMRRLTPIAIREVAVFDTDDVAPVVHAYWERIMLPFSQGYQCSKCSMQIAPAYKGTFKYCPNCGAKMDEEVET